MDDDQERAFNFVVGLRDTYLGYHAAKEREAYVAAALYLGASVAFYSRYRSEPPPLLFLIGMIAATIAVALFVAFQLYNRWLARRIVTAAQNVSARWLETPPAPADYAPPRDRRRVLWPAAVIADMRAQRPGVDGFVSLALPLLLLVWGGAIVWPALPGRLNMRPEHWLNAIGLIIGSASSARC